MKKTALSLLGVLALTITIPVNASETRETNSTNNYEGPRYERIYSHRYTKTVTRYYNDNGYIPPTIYYSEYNDGFQSTFKGTLEIYSVRRSNGGTRVTYTGTLTGFWN